MDGAHLVIDKVQIVRAHGANKVERVAISREAIQCLNVAEAQGSIDVVRGQHLALCMAHELKRLLQGGVRGGSHEGAALVAYLGYLAQAVLNVGSESLGDFIGEVRDLNVSACDSAYLYARRRRRRVPRATRR